MFQIPQPVSKKPTRGQFRDGTVVVGTVADVATFMRRSTRTVATWLGEGCPGSRGNYDLAVIVAWVREHVPLPSVAPAEKPADNSDLEREKLEIHNAGAKLKLQILAGKVVDRASAIAKVEQMFATVAARLTAIPDEVGAGLPLAIQADITEDWRHAIELALMEMSGWQCPGDAPDLDGPAAAPEDEPAPETADAASDDQS